jgi:small subunit ribosomal protein S12e
VETRDELGEWLGHCKYDKEGKPRKVKGCSSIAILNYGEETEALSFVHKYIKDNKLDE